tara:strand:- start:13 stop:468 length:456 start_codon:yes stop_codon:yes gene_type:complete
MKVVIQRVRSANVAVNEQIVSEIGNGIVLLWGVKKGDSFEDADNIINKIGNLRIFSDDSNKMNKSIKEIEGEILLVSQFTLLANTSKGNRPSFIDAETPDLAAEMIKYCANKLSKFSTVKEGIFGANMKVSIENDGPVTIVLESENGKLQN